MPKILLVDDEEDILTTVGGALKLKGHTVDTAKSAEAAVTQFEKSGSQYDVVVVDYVLRGGMQALELILTLRKFNPFLRCIVISGQIDHDELAPAEVERLMKDELVIDRYLAKPVSTADLDDAIKRAMLPDKASQQDWSRIAKDAVAAQRARPSKVRSVKKGVKKKGRKK